MKRKNEEETSVPVKAKKQALSSDELKQKFRDGLFDEGVLNAYVEQYAESQPYKHAVISNLINDSLLRNVRAEITSHLSFTPKETDIYKIHQSGDLANLDGLDDASLARLPSLLALRDALYSAEFRAYVSAIANVGPLSGAKTDMAINVYTPGCHLLCHDDVIGSRRVSYILYLTDPDKPWRAEWGGALRLYPTETMGEGEERALVPLPDFSVVIPPAWNQLSFFAVQPGESFHDVEEVYARGEGEPGEDVDGGRVRMAISGWFHIPQEGEEGYEPGAEEKLAARSSLSQLEGKADQYDLPQPRWREYDGGAQEDGYEKGKAKLEEVGQQAELSEDDLQFLLRFMTPHYLTPDTVEELSELFADESSLRLSNLLSPKFSAHLREFVEEAEKNSEIPSSKADGLTGKARPPHKHRFLYRHAADESPEQADAQTPYDALLDTFLPSTAFKKWLSLATGLTLSRSNVLARRFRRGLDYTLATSYDEPEPQLEICLAITPSKGWGEEENEDEEAEDDETSEDGDTIEHDKANGRASRADEPPRGKKAPWNGTENGDAQKGSTAAAPAAAPATETDGVGGYEVYMAGDDDDDEEDAANGREVTGDRSTGAGQRRRRADPAVYRSGGGAEDEDGVLFSMAPSWNNMSIVLRDTGVLRFVKYVSRAARGDRWDVVGDFGVVPEEDEAEE